MAARASSSHLTDMIRTDSRCITGSKKASDARIIMKCCSYDGTQYLHINAC